MGSEWLCVFQVVTLLLHDNHIHDTPPLLALFVLGAPIQSHSPRFCAYHRNSILAVNSSFFWSFMIDYVPFLEIARKHTGLVGFTSSTR